MNDLPIFGAATPVDECDLSTYPARGEWVPQWIVKCDGFDAGIAIDDHCVVVLFQDFNGKWGPATHIPPQLIPKLEEYTGAAS